MARSTLKNLIQHAARNRGKTGSLGVGLWVALWTLPVLVHSAFLTPVFGAHGSFDRTHYDAKDLILGLVMIALLIPVALVGPWPRRLRPIGILTLVIIISEFVAVGRSEYPTQALFRTMFDVVLIAWCWWWWVRLDRENLTRILCGLCFGMTGVLCVVGLVSVWRTDPRVMTLDPVGHRYYWAELLMAAAPLACLHPKSLTLWRNGLLMLIPVGTLLIVLGRRMPVLGLVIAAVAVAAVVAARQYRAGGIRLDRKKLLVGLAAVALVSVTGYVIEKALIPEGATPFTPGLTSRLIETLKSVGSGDLHAIDAVRAPMYEQGTKAVFREPLGYGRGTFSLQFFDIGFRDHDPEHPPVEIPSFHPFNTFLHVAVEGGLVAGVALFVLWFWTLVRLVRRLMSSEAPGHFGYALLAGMVAFTFDSMTFSSVDYPTTRVFWAFYLVATLAWLDGGPRAAQKEKATASQEYLWRVIGIGLLGATFFFTGRHFVANNRAVLAEAMTDGAILRRLPDARARDEWLEKANGLIESALSLNPDPYEHHLTAASIARNRGDLEGCKTILRAYLEDHPYQVRVLEALAEVHALEGNGEAAAEAERRIREIWPGWTRG